MRDIMLLPIGQVDEVVENKENVVMDHMDVYPLVKEWIEEAVQANDEFTAWAVTNDIAKYHSVQHRDVRPSVHTLMLEHTENGDYTRELVSYPSGDAWKYVPARMKDTPMYAVASNGRPSDAIAAIGYDHLASDLLVKFHSGGTYRYNDVPVAVFVEFLNAPSKGKFFHARIKDVYT